MKIAFQRRFTMCKVEDKTYVYPDGEERVVTIKKFCKQSDGKSLCHDFEHKQVGRISVQPDLVDQNSRVYPRLIRSNSGQTRRSCSLNRLERTYGRISTISWLGLTKPRTATPGSKTLLPGKHSKIAASRSPSIERDCTQISDKTLLKLLHPNPLPSIATAGRDAH